MSRDWNRRAKTSVHIAPLQISKNWPVTPNASSEHSRSSSPVRSLYTSSTTTHTQMTPPLTPHSSSEALAMAAQPPRTVFPNYLRAFYHFCPSPTISSQSVTLPLCEGDVILVHSVHTNGWADGTLLASGARGWLPTNYCETYDLEPIRSLLKALTMFWDLIKGGSNDSLVIFQNQDYMRGVIAGVRRLLVSVTFFFSVLHLLDSFANASRLTCRVKQERSACLTRDSPHVLSHNGVRRSRKALLSDLSSLVKSGKRLQDIATGVLTTGNVDELLYEMVLKAFKVVIRGVRFLDAWNDKVGVNRLSENLVDLRINETGVPPTPPADSTSFEHINFEHLHAISKTAVNIADFDGASANCIEAHQSSAAFANNDQEQTNSLLKDGLSTLYTPISRSGTPLSSRPASRPTSAQHKRGSISHRVSYNTPSNSFKSSNLASDHLGAAHDAFLGVLGFFIGLHLQSRSSSDLLSTTHQSVISCRTLLAVVDAVWDRDLQRSKPLEQTKNAMYGKVVDLVQAARDIFGLGSLEEKEDLLMPHEGKRMVDAATTCVRVAGDCVRETKYVIETIGDFEFGSDGLGISASDFGNSTSQASRIVEEAGEISVPPEPTHQPPQPPHASSLSNFSLDIADDSPVAPSSTPSTTTVRPESEVFPVPPLTTTITEKVPHLPLPYLTNPSLALNSTIFGANASNHDEASRRRSFNAESFSEESIGTSSTFVESMRDSETSVQSHTSTRATTPEQSLLENRRTSDVPLHPSGSLSTLADCEEAEAQILEKTYAHELIFNKEGQISGGTLGALIERLTTHDSTPCALFVSTFYLTFRLFATSTEFAIALIRRFDYVASSPHIAGPVRLRVYNVFKGWLESHWRNEVDKEAKDLILSFALFKLRPVLPKPANRLAELCEKVSMVHGPLVPRLVSSMGKTNTSISQYISPDTPLPAPIMSKSQMNTLKGWIISGAAISILDFDPLELARQLTIKASQIFCSILPEELLATEWMKKSGSVAVNVRAMSTLSTNLANLVADSILHLEDAKKRALIIKQWIKIAKRCLELNNYDSLMAIICSLNSSTILRLRRTWDLVAQKTKNTLDDLRSIVEVSRNYAVLRQRLQNHVPPCLPFVGTYLTDLTFVDVGNQPTRQLPADRDNVGMSVINFDKHMKTAKIIGELQRFQIPYRLVEVPELQEWIGAQIQRVRRSDNTNVQNYYRRSLLLEPREKPIAQRPPLADSQHPSTFSTREGFREKMQESLFSLRS
ncbi:MAG: hypothetical protein M1812_006802 [Candelaria pacifica]|nr:MAG: hypothetical protein M1812_006802 [Candelaria pacifica]